MSGTAICCGIVYLVGYVAPILYHLNYICHYSVLK